MGCSYTCNKDPGALEPYGDISGLGVLIGFVAMAWIAVAVLIFYYLFVFDPTVDPFAVPSVSRKLNPVDDIMFKAIGFLRTPITRNGHANKKIQEIFDEFILSMADSQLLTGIAIAISGYYSMTCGLSAYHWQTVVYLIWFACLTHLSALTCLRTYLHHHKRSRSWRLVLMAALLISLSIALYPTGYFNFFVPGSITAVSGTSYDLGQAYLVDRSEIASEPNRGTMIYVLTASPAACFLKSGVDVNRAAFLSLLFSILLLWYGYIIRIGKLFEKTSTSILDIIHQTLDRCHEKCLVLWIGRLKKLEPNVAIRIATIFLPMHASLHYTLKMLVDLYCSMLLEVLSLIVSAVWATLRLSELRRIGDPGDDDWTFGQVIPLVLLAIPIQGICGLIFDYCTAKHNGDSPLLDKNHAVAGPYVAISNQNLPEIESSLNQPSSNLSNSSFTNLRSDIPLQTFPLRSNDSPSGIDDDTETINPVSSQTVIHNDPSVAEENPGIEPRLSRIFEDSRDAYKNIWGISPLIVQCTPMIYFVVVILSRGMDLLNHDKGWIIEKHGNSIATGTPTNITLVDGVIMVIISFTLMILSCQAAVHSIIYLEKSDLSNGWKNFLRLLLCACFSMVAISAAVKWQLSKVANLFDGWIAVSPIIWLLLYGLVILSSIFIKF